MWSEGGEGIFSKLVSRIIDNGDKMEELSGIVATLARGRFVLLDWKGIWDRGLISRPDSAYWLGLFSVRRGKCERHLFENGMEVEFQVDEKWKEFKREKE